MPNPKEGQAINRNQFLHASPKGKMDAILEAKLAKVNEGVLTFNASEDAVDQFHLPYLDQKVFSDLIKATATMNVHGISIVISEQIFNSLAHENIPELVINALKEHGKHIKSVSIAVENSKKINFNNAHAIPAAIALKENGIHLRAFHVQCNTKAASIFAESLKHLAQYHMLENFSIGPIVSWSEPNDLQEDINKIAEIIQSRPADRNNIQVVHVVSLNPTWVAGGVPGAPFGYIFDLEDLANPSALPTALTVTIGELASDKIMAADRDTMPCHIYFKHTLEAAKIWYQCANTVEERDKLLKFIEIMGGTDVFFGERAPQKTVANLSEAYQNDDNLGSLGTMMRQVNNESRFGSRPNAHHLSEVSQTLAQRNPFEAQFVHNSTSSSTTNTTYTPLVSANRQSYVANLIHVKNPKNLITCAMFCVGLASVVLAGTPVIDTLALKVVSALLGVAAMAASSLYLAPASVKNTLRFRTPPAQLTLQPQQVQQVNRYQPVF